MKKLTVALVLVALLTLPTMGLAGPPSDNPPKGNDGLVDAMLAIAENLWHHAIHWSGLAVVMGLLADGAPPGWAGN